jgi:hypothetical protein
MPQSTLAQSNRLYHRLGKRTRYIVCEVRHPVQCRKTAAPVRLEAQKKGAPSTLLTVPWRGQVRLQVRGNLACKGNTWYSNIGQEVTPLTQES